MDKLIIYIMLFCAFQTVNGQNICGDFESYKESQNWIKKIITLNPEDLKTKIIQRIECEQASEYIDFELTILINGYRFFNANEIPIERTVLLKLIPANAYNIGYSLCESKVYAEKCNLGFVLIDTLDKLILNEIQQLKNIRVKRRKGKIVLKIESEIEHTIELNVSGFLKKDCTKLIMKTKLKKGKNRIVIRRSNMLQFIELNLKGNRLLILI